MRRTVPLVLASVFSLPLLTACETIVDQRGFAPTPGSVEKLEVGTQSREDVVRLIGSPSSVATFNPNVWYYISQKQETWAFLKPVMLGDTVTVTYTVASVDKERGRSVAKVEVTDQKGELKAVAEHIMRWAKKLSSNAAAA